MKLFVQIPCLDEQETLASVIRDIPRSIDGVDEIKILVIDDGSSDNTSQVARREGADYVIKLPYTEGLAKSFSTGINRCLEMGADIIVNTDGDCQYEGKEIPKLIRPILEGKADIVIGDRQTDKLTHFSVLKRKLQRWGSRTVSILSDMEVPDATSGFRAYSRDVALRLNIFSRFSYTLETLIQAGRNQMTVAHVCIQSNGPTRKSRLAGKTATYLRRSIPTMLRIYALYEPLRTFFYIGGIIFLVGALGVFRFLFLWFTSGGQGHIQSLVMSSAALIIGFQVWMLGLIADLISINRRLSEEILYRAKKQATAPAEDTTSEAGENLKSPLAREETALHSGSQLSVHSSKTGGYPISIRVHKG